MFFICLLFIVLSLVTIRLQKIRTGGLATANSILWTCNIVGGWILCREAVDWYIAAFIWLWLAVAIFNLALLTGSKFNIRTNCNETTYMLRWGRSERIMIFYILLGITYTMLLLNSNGFSIRDFFSFDRLVHMNMQMAHKRYVSGEAQQGLIMQILSIFLYAAPILGGYLLNYNKKSILCYLTLAPLLICLIIQNTKASMVAAVLLFGSGYIVGRIERFGALPKLKIKNMIYLIIGSILILCIIILSMMLRIGKFDAATFQHVLNKFLNYAFGQVPAFSYWFSQGRLGKGGLGVYTFMGIANFIGLEDRASGLYLDFYRNGTFINSNIYTAFRPLIEDYGLYVSLLLCIAAGILLGICHSAVKTQKCSGFAVTCLAAGYFYVGFSFITSAWSYLGQTLAFVIFYFSYQFIWKKRKGSFILNRKV